MEKLELSVLVGDDIAVDAFVALADSGDVAFAEQPTAPLPDPDREHAMYSIDFGTVSELTVTLVSLGGSLVSLATALIQVRQLAKQSKRTPQVRLRIGDKEVVVDTDDIETLKSVLLAATGNSKG